MANKKKRADQLSRGRVTPMTVTDRSMVEHIEIGTGLHNERRTTAEEFRSR
jgi:hypothetical protein